MSKKSVGIGAEREIIHMFWKEGWAAVRVAGSGSIKYPSPDVLASNNLRKLAIECKSTRGVRQHFSRREIEELKQFSRVFGAEAWVAVKFKSGQKGWWFLSVEDLNETEKGYSVKPSMISTRGMSFEEVLGMLK